MVNFIFHQSKPSNQTISFSATDEWMMSKFCIAFSEIWASFFTHPIDQALFFEDIDISKCYRTGHWVTRIGIPMVKVPALVDKHIGHTLTDHHATQRQVARSHAFGKCNQIRFYTQHL